jgi:ferric-dicitrate binding protein FerR (iron transport regulator)
MVKAVADSNMPGKEAFYIQLVQRYANNEATEEELEVFFHLLATGALDAVLANQMDAATGIDAAEAVIPGEEGMVVPFKKRPWRQWTVAAAVLFLLAVGTWFFVHTGHRAQQPAVTVKVTDIMPGATKATLTLEDGRQVALDTAFTGVLAQQGSARLVGKNGALVYEGAAPGEKLRYNTLTTHKGEQYPLTLSDGTKILADASTTLRFPVAFTGKDRTVEINGRAWFEVAKGTRPFYVVKGDKRVQVLGTQFDVNAYDDEADLKVTLIAGRVQVMNQTARQLLEPGQQAILDKNNAGIQLVRDADLEQATSWINGKITFHNADVPTIMRAVERWYDVDVEIRGALPARNFYFTVSRTAPLSELLHFLEIYHIHYTLDGITRKLVLMP